MTKKIVWICVIVLFATLIYTVGLPSLRQKRDHVDDPKIITAVMAYANTQMPVKCLNIPSKADSWLVEEVEILKLHEIPGPHSRRQVDCRLRGGYRLLDSNGNAGKSISFKVKCRFLISNKYPEGISVQMGS